MSFVLFVTKILTALVSVQLRKPLAYVVLTRTVLPTHVYSLHCAIREIAVCF